MHAPSDHATHRQFLIFTLAANCETEAKDAYMKMKLRSRGSAWNTNMDVVSLLNRMAASTTVTWCESFLQAVLPHFLLFFSFFFFCDDLNHELVLLSYI